MGFDAEVGPRHSRAEQNKAGALILRINPQGVRLVNLTFNEPSTAGYTPTLHTGMGKISPLSKAKGHVENSFILSDFKDDFPIRSFQDHVVLDWQSSPRQPTLDP